MNYDARSGRHYLIVGLLTLALLMSISCQSKAEIQVASTSAKDRPISSLRDLNQAFVDIAAEVKPTVVTVSIEKVFRVRSFNPFSPFGNDPFFDFFFGPHNRQFQQPRERKYLQKGLGSGVIVSEDGYILTNNHVVENADSIFVRTYDGERYTAEVIGTDPQTDIAVIKIDAKHLKAITIGNSDDLQVGEIVLAVGSPMSENLAYTVTQGIVSAKGRSNVGLTDYEDYIQTDAAINPGNSGGPLVNLDGQLVGINSAIASQSGGFQGIGFAVPSNMAVQVMNSLISNGKVIRGWLGVSIQDVDDKIANAMGLDEPRGVLVGDVVPDSPADDAGMEAGDVIIGLNGSEIKNSSQLRNKIAATAPGTRVQLKIIRDGRRQELTIKLGELPDEIAQSSGKQSIEEKLGFTVSTLNNDLADKYGIDSRLSGVVVTSIDPGCNAYQAGLREGDVIRGVNKNHVRTKEQFMKYLAKKKEGDTILLRIYRDGSGFFIAFDL